MHRINLGLSMLALTGVALVMLLPRAGAVGVDSARHRHFDISAAGIDYMPVGTAKEVARVKRAKPDRKS